MSIRLRQELSVHLSSSPIYPSKLQFTSNVYQEKRRSLNLSSTDEASVLRAYWQAIVSIRLRQELSIDLSSSPIDLSTSTSMICIHWQAIVSIRLRQELSVYLSSSPIYLSVYHSRIQTNPHHEHHASITYYSTCKKRLRTYMRSRREFLPLFKE